MGVITPLITGSSLTRHFFKALIPGVGGIGGTLKFPQPSPFVDAKSIQTTTFSSVERENVHPFPHDFPAFLCLSLNGVYTCCTH